MYRIPLTGFKETSARQTTLLQFVQLNLVPPAAQFTQLPQKCEFIKNSSNRQLILIHHYMMGTGDFNARSLAGVLFETVRGTVLYRFPIINSPGHAHYTKIAHYA